ncbi:MAG: endolytic transglycosylase MltG [Gammaproteobacteria bacterium]|nr:endolytic transglycosylase MltG [Gammaproteobacteria bacterium]MYC98069.1 endolytic transglycosylase MltG [Gammaproteobacteria bacterium]
MAGRGREAPQVTRWVMRTVGRRGAALGWPRIALGTAAGVILLGGASVLLRLAAPVETPGGLPADGETVVFTVAPGATFGQITDTLVARGLIRRPLLFHVYARLRRDERNVRAGTYALDAGTGWPRLLDALVEGRVRMVAVTIPEGFTLPRIATRVAGITELPADTVRVMLGGEDAHTRWNLPGPGLEGYLFPDTYLFAGGVPLDAVVDAMSERYRSYWTPERQARAAELGLSEREVVTLASIIQAEARASGEMPAISAVYHNRLRIGMLLQADPTVLYALGGHRPRLLFAAMDSVADHPYNTYTQGGLPPGPIGAPGAAALDAALHPAEVDYLYFVANADGSHTFSRTLSEHNRAVARSRRGAAGAGSGGG